MFQRVKLFLSSKKIISSARIWVRIELNLNSEAMGLSETREILLFSGRVFSLLIVLVDWGILELMNCHYCIVQLNEHQFHGILFIERETVLPSSMV